MESTTIISYNGRPTRLAGVLAAMLDLMLPLSKRELEVLVFILSGLICNQAALNGVLKKINNLGLMLISVRKNYESDCLYRIWFT